MNKLSEENLKDNVEVEDEWGSDSDGEEDHGQGVSYADALKGRPDIGPCTTTLKRAEEGK